MVNDEPFQLGMIEALIRKTFGVYDLEIFKGNNGFEAVKRVREVLNSLKSHER